MTIPDQRKRAGVDDSIAVLGLDSAAQELVDDPVPYSPPLERAVLPSAGKIEAAIRKTLDG